MDSEYSRKQAPLSRRQAFWLLLLIAAGTIGTHIALLPSEPVSLCFHDEVHYFQQSRDVAAGGFPRYNQIIRAKFPPLYGVLTAPAWWIGGTAGFPWWVRVLNVVYLASAMIPAYRLARTQMHRGWSVVAAALAILMPVQCYLRFLLSETVLIPMMLWLALVFVRLSSRPSVRRALVVGVLLGLCMHAKMVMVMAAPAMVMALGWARRSWREAMQYAVWMGLAAGLIVGPYIFRGHLFPSESGVKVNFSYWGEFISGGHQPFSLFLHFFLKEPGFFLVGLGMPILLLSLHGLFSGMADEDPARRAWSGLVLLASLFIHLLVTVWLTQAAYYAADFHERYFLCLWPLFTVAFIQQLSAPARKIRPFLLALLVTAVLFILTPDALLNRESLSVRFNIFDAPSTPGIMALGAAAGIPIGIRLLLAVPALLVGLFLFSSGRRITRWAMILCLLAGGAYKVHGTVTAVRMGIELEREAHAEVAPLWRWLEGILGPEDRLIHHTTLDSLVYQNAIHFNQNLLVVRQDLTPHWVSGLVFDPRTGRYTLPGGTPAGEIYLLSSTPGPRDKGRISPCGRFRLLRVTDGLGPLGQWLISDLDTTRSEGIHPDQWCSRKVRITLPTTCGQEYEAGLTLLHPDTSPLSGDLNIQIRWTQEYTSTLTLPPGKPSTVVWTCRAWLPEFWVEVEADRSFERGGKEMAFKIEGFYLKPGGGKSGNEGEKKERAGIEQK